ncbi:MAG: M6 family metalloprotease domain-containing protein [Tannerellaceae bacterium]|jgi:M6 family metalloprotease-like protein|nr:M6 family metalloprotease domain-containing protein [Tannerellaceae bacterium]
MVKNYLFILFLGVLSLFARDVFAVTAVPWPVEKTQPDGTVISVYLRGDEKVHWMESMDGYTLMYDNQKYIVYAKQDARGNMVPSNTRYDNKAVQVAFPKGLKYSKDQTEALKQIWEVTSDSDRQRSSGQQRAGSTIGERKALCVLVGFSDRPFGKAKGDYETLFNQLGLAQIDPATRGSVRDFFRENSYEQLDFTVTVVGPYVAPNTTEYYATHEKELAAFAATAADADVNYKDFANNNTLETFHILFAGYGDENIDNGKQIWSHKWQLASPITLDGVKISVYSCSPELRGKTGNDITYIGVVCHELSHVFGSPDYYDTSNSGFPGAGYWDLMASGSWNDNGRQPAHINMFQKILYGWVDPIALTTQTTITDMPPSALEPVAYTIQANDNGELYVLDNKQKKGFDASLPGHGLLIWHIHPAALGGRGSNASHPQQLYPVYAASTMAIPDGTPTSYGPKGNSGTPFPGTANKTSFAHNTTPAMFTWTGLQPVAKPVTEITEAADGTISFKFLDGPTDPVIDFDATVTGNAVRLDWAPPARDDIQGYKIFRDGTLQFSTSNKDMTTYTQAGVPKGNYEYCISVTYSITESEKTCLPVAVTTGGGEFYLPISDLQATAGINEVNLNWVAPFSGGWAGIAGNYAGYYTYSAVRDFFAGTLWNPSDLKGLNGFEITKVKFVPLQDINIGATYAVAIYEVPAYGDPILLYSQNVTGTLDYPRDYNEITLNSPVIIDATKGVIVGMQVHTEGIPCLPISQGEPYPGRNILYNGSEWRVMEDLNVDLGNNYCLQVYFDGVSTSILPSSNIPANTSFLKKNSDNKLKIGERIVNNGLSQVPPAVTVYHIYRNGVEVDTSPTTSYTDSGLTPITAYTYCVTAEYAGGGLSEGVCIEVETDTPFKPVTNLKAQVNFDEINLTWVPVGTGTITYNVYEEGTPIATGLTSPQYTLTGVEVGTYNYCVTAVYDGVNESEAVCVNAYVLDPYRPVFDFNAAMTEPFKGELTWKAPVFVQRLRHHTYDSGTYDVMPAAANIDFDVATRWTPEELGSIDGLILTKIRFVPVAPKTSITYSVRVWIGGGNPFDRVYEPGQMVVDQPIPDHTVGEWNEIVLDTPVLIDPTKEIWIGLHMILSSRDNAVSRQTTNTLNGRGNLIFQNRAWSTLTDLSSALTGNWIIDGIVAYHKGLDPSVSLPVLKNENNRMPFGTLSALPAVTKYLITRDGEELGETTETTYTDAVTTAATHTYCVQVAYDDESTSEPACMELTYVQTPITITTASIETKTYNGTTEGTVTSVTFNDGTNDLSLTLDEDFSVTAEFNDPNAGTDKTVTITVTMLTEACLLNETTFELTNQFIIKAIPDYTVPTLGAFIGQTLADVVLPQGWSWDDDPIITSVGAEGTHQYPATYTPDDLTNYEIVPAIPVTVVVIAMPTYDVTIAASANGSIDSDKAFAEENELVTLTASPDTGYDVDEVTATKTGDDDTIVEVSGSGLTYTFIMPAYEVTVQATFKKTDAQILEEIKESLEEETYTVDQATANTSAQITDWVVQQINNLILSTGVTVSAAADITIDAFTAAVEGTEAVPDGVNGSFAFTASLAWNAATTTTISISGTITPIIYTPLIVPEIYYSLNIPEVEGLITNWSAGTYTVSEHVYVMLNFRAAEGYSIADMHVYANGIEQTLTINSEGISELVFGYLKEDITITVEGIEQSGSVGIMTSPDNGILRALKADGGLHVYGLKPSIELRIYNVSGILVYRGKAIDTELFITLHERGFYIIIADGSSVKVVL